MSTKAAPKAKSKSKSDTKKEIVSEPKKRKQTKDEEDAEATPTTTHPPGLLKSLNPIKLRPMTKPTKRPTIKQQMMQPLQHLLYNPNPFHQIR
jgi:hypothetical protein